MQQEDEPSSSFGQLRFKQQQCNWTSNADYNRFYDVPMSFKCTKNNITVSKKVKALCMMLCLLHYFLSK